MKKYRKAVVLGKFMPLHMGHLALIDKALSVAERVCVIVDRPPGEHPDAETRGKWVLSERSVEVVALGEETPQHPDEKENFWEIWRDILKRSCPDADCIVSSESYGARLGEETGWDDVRFDQERRAFPFGARDLRGSLAPKERMRMAPSARAFHARLVVARGPEVSGKTTFGEHLRLSGWRIVPEVAAEMCAKGANPYSPETLLRFATAQSEAIESALRESNGFVFADSDAWSTLIWARELLGESHPVCARILIEAERVRRPNETLCFEALPFWEDAPHRSFDDRERAAARRGRMFDAFVRLSSERGENLTLVSEKNKDEILERLRKESSDISDESLRKKSTSHSISSKR